MPSYSYRIRLLLVYPILSGYVLAVSVVVAVLFSIPLVLEAKTFQPMITLVPMVVVTHLFLFPLTAILVYCYRVAISPDFIWCLDLWSNLVPVSWGSIRAVRRLVIPGFPVYILESSEQKRWLFVPRFLIQYEEFVEKVEEYGGSNNPLYLAIWRSAEPQEQ